MKKKLACLLLACALFLCGCGKEQASEETEPLETERNEEALSEPAQSEADAEGASESDADDIWASEDIPAPVVTPQPTPIPVVDVNSYTYSKVNNQALDVSFKYPSHWINEPGTFTISYVEPVEEGEIASRLSVTTKKYEGEMKKAFLQQEAKDFSAVLATTCDKYDRDHVGMDVQLLGHSAYSFQYTGEIDGKDIHGFAIVGFDAAGSRLYALNFYSTQEKFRHFDIVRRVVVGSVGRAS